MAKKPKLRPDMNEVAYRTMLAVTGQAAKSMPPGVGEPNPEAVKRGRKGGKKGGPARALALSDQQLKKIARKAARTRWKKKRQAD